MNEETFIALIFTPVVFLDIKETFKGKKKINKKVNSFSF